MDAPIVQQIVVELGVQEQGALMWSNVVAGRDLLLEAFKS